ncbi:MAG: RNA-binding S4 domain-containing protein [Clostridia bacterium]|nr:RNA-binding S4 domain-containing protein [Clostridia bacterium]
MRLDKFLKVSRVIKRRTVANEACDAGRVMINGKIAKASTEVKVDDIVEIKYGEKMIKFRIKNVTNVVTKEGALEMVEMLENE